MSSGETIGEGLTSQDRNPVHEGEDSGGEVHEALVHEDHGVGIARVHVQVDHEQQGSQGEGSGAYGGYQEDEIEDLAQEPHEEPRTLRSLIGLEVFFQ